MVHELHLSQGTWEPSVNTSRDQDKLLAPSVLFTKDILVRGVVLVRLLASRMVPEVPTDKVTGLWLAVLGLNPFPNLPLMSLILITTQDPL